MSEKARVVVVDDHPLFRERLCQLINNEPDMQICGEADSAQEAIQIIRETSPNLAIIDITLKTSSGLELIKSIKALSIGVPVLVLSMHDESLYAERVLRAGARGYIMKQERPGKLIEAIRSVLSGKAYVSDKMAARILDVFSGRRPKGSSVPLERLTDREFEILELIGRGKSSHEIAKALHLSVRTVDTHRTHLKGKLKLKSALQLTHYAVCWVGGQNALPA